MFTVMRVCAAMCLMAVLLGCGGGSSNTLLGKPSALPAPFFDSTALLPPVEAMDSQANREVSAMLLERFGSDYEATQAQRVAPEDTGARFSPVWTGSESTFDEVAYATFGFNLAGYAGNSELHLDWNETPEDSGNIWIGLSNWNSNCWDLYPGSLDGTLVIGGMGFSDYIYFETGDMLVTVVTLGTVPALLDKIQIGEITSDAINITGVTPDPAIGNTSAILIFDVQFTGTVDISTAYSWDFDGGAIPNGPTEKSPVVNLGTSGLYNCSVTVNNDYGSPDTYNFTLTVLGPINITDITPTPTRGLTGTAMGFDVQFTGTEDATTVYIWDFVGGATPNGPVEKSPTVTLGDVGIYDCSVIVGNDYGIPDVYQFELYVIDPINISGITPDPAEGIVGANLSFDVQYTGKEDGTTTYAWDFNGSTFPGNSSERSPTVTLSSLGTHNCSVVVDNAWGDPDSYDFTLTINGPITISGVTPDPAIGSEAGELTFDVQFDGTDDGTTTYTWDFNGGAIPDAPTVKSPTVTLGSAGTYFCSVTVDNDYGVPDVYAFGLTVTF